MNVAEIFPGEHDLALDPDDPQGLGWWAATCACGWVSDQRFYDQLDALRSHSAHVRKVTR